MSGPWPRAVGFPVLSMASPAALEASEPTWEARGLRAKKQAKWLPRVQAAGESVRCPPLSPVTPTEHPLGTRPPGLPAGVEEGGRFLEKPRRGHCSVEKAAVAKQASPAVEGFSVRATQA